MRFQHVGRPQNPFACEEGDQQAFARRVTGVQPFDIRPPIDEREQARRARCPNAQCVTQRGRGKAVKFAGSHSRAEHTDDASGMKTAATQIGMNRRPHCDHRFVSRDNRLDQRSSACMDGAVARLRDDAAR